MTTEPTPSPFEITLGLAGELEQAALRYGEALGRQQPPSELDALSEALHVARMALYASLTPLENSYRASGHYASPPAPKRGDAPSEAPGPIRGSHP